MLTLRQSLYIEGAAGEPLPVVFKGLPTFQRGQLCLICAAAGVGKSAFVLAYALRAKCPTLYFSADSDGFTQLSRSLSILTGKPLSATSVEVRSRDLNGDVDLIDAMPIQFDYRAAPSLEQIRDAMNAWAQRDGEYPELVIVDNITNVRTELNAEDPFAGLEVVMDEFHQMARSTGSCVTILHHVTGPYNDGNRPIPLSGIKGQIGRVPEMILTIHKIASQFGPRQLRVSTVKARSGPSDPTGATYAALEFDGETMTIKNY